MWTGSGSNFDIVGKLTTKQGKEIKETLGFIDGINHVTIHEEDNKVTVG
jgi:hypothetical protein